MALNEKQVIVGRSVDDFVTSKIAEARERVIVMSPWISEFNAAMLLNKAKQGVNVKLYVIDDMRNNANAILTLLEKKVLKERFINKPLVKIGLSLLGVWAILSVLSFILLHFLINTLTIEIDAFFLLAGLVLIIIGVLKKNYVWISKLGDGLRVYRNLEGSTIHAKVYIVDDWVGLGSVNFTFSGLKKNLESFIWIHDQNLAEEVLRQVEMALSRETVLTYDVVGKMAEAMKKNWKRENGKQQVFVHRTQVGWQQ